jgi:hypothetical protein
MFLRSQDDQKMFEKSGPTPASLRQQGQPDGSFNAHWFQLFNAVSFQIMMGAPIILFAKSLGASSTVLGIVASFTPLMTVFQLPAARHFDRYGYLREQSHFDVATVLYLSALSFVGALVVLPFTGSVIDGLGSKPLMRMGTGGFFVVIALWCLIAAGVLPCSVWLVDGLNFLAGAASANFNVANVRITMATMPEMGRNHFFALFTVITSLGLGAAPVAWGVTLDVIGGYEVVTGIFHWKRHSIYFLALLVLNAIAFAYIRRLHESPAAGRMEPTLIYGRLKRLPRIWHR